jgi:hypothetical protein
MRAEEFKLSESIDLYYWPTRNSWKDAKLGPECKKAERFRKKNVLQLRMIQMLKCSV